MTTSIITDVLSALERTFGVPKQTARKNDLVGELIGTILSQNTTDKNSSRAYAKLVQQFPSWDNVLRAKPAAIASAIKSGGLANIKAQRIRKILSQIKKQNGGKISLDFLRKMTDKNALTHLLALNGVGLKTAYCVLMFGMRHDLCPVDTHIHRIANRLGLVQTKHADETHIEFANLLPKGKAYAAHINLIRLGRTICKSQTPQCHACPLAGICRYADETGVL